MDFCGDHFFLVRHKFHWIICWACEVFANLCLKMLPDNVFSAALGSFQLKRSIPPHLPWWYFYVNLANITRKPENASHSKKKRSIRSSLSKQASLKALSLIFCKIEKRSHATLPGVLIQCIAAFHWSVHFLLIRKHFWDLNFSCRSLAIFNCTVKATPIRVGGSPSLFCGSVPSFPLPSLPPFPCSNLALRVNNQTTCVL